MLSVVAATPCSAFDHGPLRSARTFCARGWPTNGVFCHKGETEPTRSISAWFACCLLNRTCAPKLLQKETIPNPWLPSRLRPSGLTDQVLVFRWPRNKSTAPMNLSMHKNRLQSGWVNDQNLPIINIGQRLAKWKEMSHPQVRQNINGNHTDTRHRTPFWQATCAKHRLAESEAAIDLEPARNRAQCSKTRKGNPRIAQASRITWRGK